MRVYMKLLPMVCLLAGCQAMEALTEHYTSTAFDIACDPGRVLSDRRSSALMVDSLENSKLRALLMKRIPNGWYSTATNDALILAAIGDEGNAVYLESLYPKLPDAREDPRSMRALLHTTAAMIRNRMQTQSWEIACDGLVNQQQRDVAIGMLSPTQRVRLVGVLLDRVPGKWDENTASDIALLGEIGDEQAAQRLEAIYKKPDYTDTSSLTSNLQDAVHQIRQRTQG